MKTKYYKSTVPEDIFIGLCYYSNHYKINIPHKIKFEKGTFFVEEIIDNNLLCKDGDLYIYRYRKPWGIDTRHLKKYLKKYSATTLGRKDKYAETIQYVISKKPIAKTGFEHIGKIDRSIRISELHIGNRFKISAEVRNLKNYKDILNEVVNTLLTSDIPNYYSYQRFGVKRRNHIMGFKILMKVYQMLTRRKNNISISYGKATDILKLYINGFQAYLFNHSLNQSIIRSGSLPKTKFKIKIKRIDGGSVNIDCYPVIGYGIPNMPDDIIKLFSNMGIDGKSLRKTLYMLRHLGIDCFGDLRPVKLILLEEITLDFRDKDVTLSFALARGQYATQVLREIFKPIEPRKQGY